MNRRNALKMGAGALALGAAALSSFSQAFKKENPAYTPKKVDFKANTSDWTYEALDPATTAQRAYDNYNSGSCMYGVVSSIVEQLAEKTGAPYSTFPLHMMRYGHGGVSGEGSLCGTLNGAASILGLIISDQKARDLMASDIFRQYENKAFPSFEPAKAIYDYKPGTSVSKSVLCHASTTRWCNATEHKIKSKERIERCRRLTADIAALTVKTLNSYYENNFVALHHNTDSHDCLSCHGSQGKVANTAGKMSCTTCHDKESLGHRVFSDVHYRLMKE